MRTLYMDCASGISGDMTVAALLDLGAGEDRLRAGLAGLGLDGFEIVVSRIKKSGIDACDFDVRLHSDQPPSPENRRNLADVLALIDNASSLTPNAARMARRIFTVKAEAEAAVHKLPLEEVYFHEAGALDSIIDIVGASICVDALNVDEIVCSPLTEGSGTVETRFGTLPVPVPATLEIARAHRIPLILSDIDGELVTPTGAAIVAALAGRFARPGELQIAAAGYGAGKRDCGTGLLRALLLEVDGAEEDAVLLLECNLDDMTGEQLAYACEKLLAAGALDVWCTPIFMKKGRPAQLLSMLCADDPAQERLLTGLLFAHTSTIGIRRSRRERRTMTRSFREIATPYGPLTVKDCRWEAIYKTTVEYESARLISETCKIPIDEVYRSVYNDKDA